jgi:small GTP-binding protein
VRPLRYPTIDVSLACFDVTNRSSLDSVAELWIPEVRHHRPDVPYIVVGTKIDLRDDRLARGRERPVTYKEGARFATEFGAYAYVECSALTQVGLKNVFNVVRTGLVMLVL